MVKTYIMKAHVINKHIFLLSSVLLFITLLTEVKAQHIDTLHWNKARNSAYRSLNGIGTDLDYKKAYMIFRRLAISGDPESVNALGMMYKNGLGVKQDDDKALQFFSKASEMGNPKATYNLALAYRYGSGVEQDPKKAYELFDKAKLSGLKTTDYALGYSYYKGLGVKQDYNKAIEHFTVGAEQGNPACMFNLGLCYFRGRGVDKDPALGKEWIEKAALKGFSRAIDFIARVDSKTYGKPKVRTKSINTLSLDTQIPLTHQVVKMPARAERLKSTSNGIYDDISGQWEGKIITYDWSGMEIEEEIDLEVVIESVGNSFQGLWIENGNYPVQVYAELGDTSWIFTNTVLRENARPLEMRNGSLIIEQRAGQDYLIGNLYFYSNVTREYTAPNYVLLYRKQGFSSDNVPSDILVDNNHSILAYPNPFTDYLNIRFTLDSEQKVSITLFNMSGNQVYAEKPKVYTAGTHTVPISTGPYAKGAYILNISGSLNKSLILIK